MVKRLLITLLVITSISALTGKRIYEQSTSLDKVGLDRPEIVTDQELAPFLEDFEAFSQYRIEKEEIPGAAIAVVKDGRIIYLNTFGLQEMEGYDSINYHTAFRLASVSKGFAPILTGMLVEDGILNWDDKVIDYLPDFELRDPRNTRELTLRHVLSHTSGLPRHTYTNLLDDGVPYIEIRKRLSNVRISNQVGESYAYQNVVYSLIGEIIEKATGKTYQQLLQEKIFTPLEMRDASASYQALIDRDNRAIPHRIRRGRYEKMDLSPNYYDASPAAGVNASITDMAKWMVFLLGNRPDIISDMTLNEVFRPHIEIPYRDKVLGNWRSQIDRAYYALGWRVLDRPHDRIIYHGGYVNGFRSEVALLPEEGLGVAILTNSTSHYIAESLPTFFRMYDDFRETRELMAPLLSSR